MTECDPSAGDPDRVDDAPKGAIQPRVAPEEAVPDEVYEDGAGPSRLNRRTLMRGAAVAAGVATVTYFWLEGMGNPKRPAFVDSTEAGAPAQSLTDLERRTLAAIQDRLLPSSAGSPGASDANTIGYLDALLASDFLSDYSRQLVRWGAGNINAASMKRHGREYGALRPPEQDTLLREYEGREDGVRWMNKLLAFTLEGFFGDPVHGSNVNETAWNWIQHRPGFPRPTVANWRPEGR